MVMSMLQMLRWFLLAAEVWIAGPVLYLCVLSVSAILNTRNQKDTSPSSDSTSSYTNFAILVPAHNEEVTLGTLLDNLSQLAYPKDQYTVYVVADNCTDNTAELARKTGWIRVYERFDPVKRGKGYALNWLLQKLEEDQSVHEAYVILDADSVVVPTFLQVMNRELVHGARALQARNTVLNLSESPSAALRWITLALINHVRPLGRNGLGGSSTLTGNGMCLSRALLMRYPWQAFSVAEDYQYYLTLVEHGERVRYVPEAIVPSLHPTTFAQMRAQDIRWESAAGSQTKWWQVTLSLLGAGLKYRDFVRIEAIAELLTPPLSSLACWCLLTLIASLVLGSPLALLLSFMLIYGLICYTGTALYLLRPPRAICMALLYAPGFMLWKLWVLLVLKKSKRLTSEWVRTSRTVS